MKTKKQTIIDQAVKVFRQKDIENGWIDDSHYKAKLEEVEKFLTEQLGKAYDAGGDDREEENVQVNG